MILAEKWALIERFLPQLWDGTLVTLQLVGLAVLIGISAQSLTATSSSSVARRYCCSCFWSITVFRSFRWSVTAFSGPICVSPSGVR